MSKERKNYGIINSEFTPLYNEEDFNGACWFNFWIGGLCGGMTLLALEFVMMWLLGWF